MTALGFNRGWTPFPNALIDFYLPQLTDTEWRLMVIIVRQTLGWRQVESKKRRIRDRISHRHLKQRTGRQSAAISMAIESLSTKGLIIVTDPAGNRLRSAAERRRSKRTLTFELSPAVYVFSTRSELQGKNRNSETEKNKTYSNDKKLKEIRDYT